MSCHLHAEACDCKAYLIAMGENDRLLEADLEREEAKTVRIANVSGYNKRDGDASTANAQRPLDTRAVGGPMHRKEHSTATDKSTATKLAGAL